ncbi:MAG: hypothetical protein HY738_15690 [Bacteroidia bacterium]|nr:hypothetical protein [Bacteroidia bacterium]
MNKLLGILLFFCLATPFIGTYTWLQFQKSLIKEDVKKQIIAGINEKKLTLLKFTKSEIRTKLHWEHSEEFMYNEQMYDIVKTEINGDTISYWCLQDFEETRLNKKINDIVVHALGNNPQNKENQKRLADFFKTLFYPRAFIWAVHLYSSEKFLFSVYFTNYISKFILPPDPPPETDIANIFIY